MSPEPSDLQISPPEDWQVFERHMRDLLEAHWGPPVQMHGRTGQPQCGVDIYGRPKRADGYHGVQCKGKDSLCDSALTEKELRHEVRKAEKFEPKLSHFILATTGPHDDKIQKVERELNTRKGAPFTVEVMFWKDIKALYDQHRDVYAQHYENDTPRTTVSVQSPNSQGIVNGPVNTITHGAANVTANVVNIHSGLSPENVTQIVNEIVEHQSREIAKREATISQQKARIRQYEDAIQELRSQLEAAIQRVAAQAHAGDKEAQLAIAEARESGDPGRLRSVLSAMAEDLRSSLNQDANRYVTILLEVAAIAFMQGDINQAESQVNEVLKIYPDNLPGLNQLGHIQYLRGDLQGAEESYRRILTLAAGDPKVEASVLDNLGIVYQTRGDLDQAEKLHRQALAIEQRLSWSEGIASSCSNLGNVLAARGDLAQAQDMYMQALLINQSLGRLTGMASNYGNLGNVSLIRGNLQRAKKMFRRSLEIEKQLGRLEGVAADYCNLGIAYQMEENLEVAERMFRQALEIEKKLGNLEGTASNYGNLGNICRTRGDLEQAEKMYQLSLEIELNLGRPEGIAGDYCNLGILYQQRGNLEQAEKMYREALDVYQRLGSLDGMGSSYGNIGNICQDRGDPEQAKTMYQQALAMHQKLGRLDGIAHSYNNLGIVCEKSGETAQAREMWSKALDSYRQLGAAQEVHKIEQWLKDLPADDKAS